MARMLSTGEDGGSNAVTHLSRVEINLVADDDKRKVVRITRTRLDEELVSPGVQRTE